MHRCVVDIKYAVDASKPQGSQLFGLAALSHPEKGSLVILQRPVQASLNQSLGRKGYLNHASQLQSAGASKPHYQFWNQIFESTLRVRLEVVDHSMPTCKVLIPGAAIDKNLGVPEQKESLIDILAGQMDTSCMVLLHRIEVSETTGRTPRLGNS
ncbi:predicted protein [Histoplasma capsulatum H143]|uniref:Uncharacterized protein n=1 Tax=Ajellomyces capsulatus (strain H143) TaxID=544712 RepID=C6HDE8_AJECH|nr:predicted protein [Histoplasma capsulatum H143]